jgi:hypothetical protein
VDLVRRLDESRRRINPRFIIVNNNTWDRGNADPRGLAGEPYVDGVVLEHHAATETFNTAYAGHAFGNLGHRRVLIIAQSTADAQAWQSVPGVTHISDQSYYGYPTPPPVGFERLTDRPKTFGRTDVATRPSSGMTSDYKRASKFSLAEHGKLVKLSAYLDGLGGPTQGSQSVRLVVYADNSGVPGTKVVESSPVNIAAGQAGKWVDFSVSNVALQPGNYWIALFTGGTSGIARNWGDGAADWYGNNDTYSDGAASTFGSGNTGSVTLSVYASYTVE